MMTFNVENFTDIAHELPPLFQKHFDEIALDKERIPLAPNWEYYLAVDKSGHLFVLTARDGERLVGYFFAIVGLGTHNVRSVMAKTDMYFLLPEYRKGMAGFKFIKTAMERLTFDKMVIQTKISNDYGRIFERLGFTSVETVYTKVSKWQS